MVGSEFFSTQTSGTAPKPLLQYPPARFNPISDAVQDGDQALVHAPERIGQRISVVGELDVNALGEAVHGFLVQDDPSQGLEIRIAQALGIFQRWKLSGLAPEDIVTASDRLIAYLQRRSGEGKAPKEHPVHLRVGNQIAAGWIDLVWQTPNGYVIADHKSYMGRLDTVQKHGTPFVAQLNVYAECLEKALGAKPLALLVHLPMIGLMAEIGRRGR